MNSSACDSVVALQNPPTGVGEVVSWAWWVISFAPWNMPIRSHHGNSPSAMAHGFGVNAAGFDVVPSGMNPPNPENRCCDPPVIEVSHSGNSQCGSVMRVRCVHGFQSVDPGKITDRKIGCWPAGTAWLRLCSAMYASRHSYERESMNEPASESLMCRTRRVARSAIALDTFLYGGPPDAGWKWVFTPSES